MKMSIFESLEIVTKRKMGTRILCLLALMLFVSSTLVYPQSPTVRFAVVGDFGSGDANEGSVANLIKSWNPDFIITVGDNNYPDGEAATIDDRIGRFYQEFIHPYQGGFGPGAPFNRFFPSLGNHDWDNRTGMPAQPYLDYFVLPGNERYYEFIQGPVHFFVIDSDPREPDGITANSPQAAWLQNRLAASNAPWKIVYMHHPPFSSRTSFTKLQWAYQQWGATAVLAGHAHVYERVMKNGMPYFTNGLGGDSLGSFDTAIEGSAVRFGSDYGAQIVTANSESINFQFVTRAGVVIDNFTIGTAAFAPPSNLTATSVASTQVNMSWIDNTVNETGFKVERCEGLNCGNFAEVATVGANATTFNDGGRTPNTAYAYRVRAYNGGNFSGYSNTLQVTTPPVVSSPLSDNFDDNVTDNSKWLFGILSRAQSNFDPQVQVFEQNGRLTIVPRSSYNPASYNGYVSNLTWDLSQYSANVELAQRAAGNAATIFSIGTNKDNWYGFRVKGNTLFLENRINGTTNGVTPPYDPVLHRFLRLRFDAQTDSVLYETSPDGASWTVRWSAPRLIPLSAVRIELIAGTTGGVANPGAALFDNFMLVPNVP